MKILDILRLLSGNPAKSRLLLWLLFSWLSSRAFCKPGLWIWENALWPFLWPQSNLLRQVISLSLPKGKNQGLVNCPGSPRLRCSLVGGSHSPGHMPSPSIRCALAALRRACQQAQLTVPWTWWSFSGRRKAHFREPYTVRAVRLRCKVLVQTNLFLLGPAHIQRGKVICLRSQPSISNFQPIVFLILTQLSLIRKASSAPMRFHFLEAG